MFEFAGRLIGKAVYECQVVDAQFAPFFLRQLTGFKSQNYSFLDDLATLDNDLYRNLNMIKYDDAVADLELTFTHSEMHLGKLVTHDLVPSGNFIKVTNENKIKYIHLLAHFKLYKQIKEQVMAFNNGFKSVIKQDWLNMFSIPEIQRLISGCSQDINFDDLKRNVQYLNGLHSSHRLIKWLWEILENDFNREERALFLKFVTSSPKPPLLGFSSLNPPFSIRVVENEEEDSTVYDASIKSFFKTVMNLGGTDTSRLPTSSTCFNLLKLPNYSKKSSLKDKLRYAIKSNSGFELS
jgi:ubiquitin-protein ligase E3 B